MELLHNLTIGFQTALSLQNLLYCFVGVLLGTLIGVLPGLGPVPTIAMLLPVTYALTPVSALIMLAGIYPRPAAARGEDAVCDARHRSGDHAAGGVRQVRAQRNRHLSAHRQAG